MGDAFHALPENLNVLRMAGIRHLFASSAQTNDDGPSYAALEAEPWPAFLAKAPRNSLSIWTYPELASDWTVSPHEDRKRLWMTLIKALAFPKGSLGFFPFALAGEANQGRAAMEFYLGIARIAPRSIVYFGVAPDHPASSLPGFVFTELGYTPLVHHAPHPNDLLAMDEAQLRDFAGSLRNLLMQET